MAIGHAVRFRRAKALFGVRVAYCLDCRWVCGGSQEAVERAAGVHIAASSDAPISTPQGQ